MKNIKKTKIVATLGPASSDRDTIKQMMVAGVNVFRINFSHADFDAAKERIQLIRDLMLPPGTSVLFKCEQMILSNELVILPRFPWLLFFQPVPRTKNMTDKKH